MSRAEEAAFKELADAMAQLANELRDVAAMVVEQNRRIDDLRTRLEAVEAAG